MIPNKGTFACQRRKRPIFAGIKPKKTVEQCVVKKNFPLHLPCTAWGFKSRKFSHILLRFLNSHGVKGSLQISVFFALAAVFANAISHSKKHVVLRKLLLSQEIPAHPRSPSPPSTSKNIRQTWLKFLDLIPYSSHGRCSFLFLSLRV